jgi:carboxypeptidase family protein
VIPEPRRARGSQLKRESLGATYVIRRRASMSVWAITCLLGAGVLSCVAPPENDAFTVRGTVLTADGQPVQGAAVLVEGTAQMTTTDSLGQFSLNGLPDPLFGIQIRKPGYRSMKCPLQGSLKTRQLRCDVWVVPGDSTVQSAVADQ